MAMGGREFARTGRDKLILNQLADQWNFDGKQLGALDDLYPPLGEEAVPVNDIL